MSNNTTGCIDANMAPMKRNVKPTKLAMQPFGNTVIRQE